MHVAAHQPLTMVLLGAPGSGKGTQAAQLSAALAIPAISTGDMLRAECASGSPLGRSIEEVLNAGRLVDDRLMNDVVAARLSRPDCRNGFILDGYPRTVQQAGFLNEFLRSRRLPAPLVVHLDVDHEEVRARLALRLLCPACGAIGSLDPATPGQAVRCAKDGAIMLRRNDDREHSAILERVRAYEAATASLVSLYQRQNYFRISGTRPIREVTGDILDLVSAVNAPVQPWIREEVRPTARIHVPN